jgi:hypothetical protein
MTCKTHPDAPHGFDRNGSHSADRYVCMCEHWEPPQPRALVLADALERMDTFTEYQRGEILKAAAELRRLHEETEKLRESLRWHILVYRVGDEAWDQSAEVDRIMALEMRGEK